MCIFTKYYGEHWLLIEEANCVFLDERFQPDYSNHISDKSGENQSS